MGRLNRARRLAVAAWAAGACAAAGAADPAELARGKELFTRTCAGCHGTYADDQFYHLWTMLLSEIWARTFIDGRGAGPISFPSRSQRTAAPEAAFPPMDAGSAEPISATTGGREQAA